MHIKELGRKREKHGDVCINIIDVCIKKMRDKEIIGGRMDKHHARFAID